MRIKFYLLWFENEPTWISGKIDDVRAIIADNGFEWVEPEIYSKESDFKGDYNNFDMILVDFRLVNATKSGETGSDIVKKIRSDDCFTNILFYSQEGVETLRAEVAKNNLDGVFCASREDFLSRFEKIFCANIKKIEDVNNLRGLVMAETADLDSLKEEIIKKYDNASCSQKKKILEEMLKEIKNTRSKQVADLETRINDENTSFKDVLDFFDLYKKSMIIHKINHRNKLPIADFIHDNFKTDVIDKRNLLAHVTEQRTKTGEIFLESKKPGAAKLIFTQSEAKKIREDISKYKKELEKILNAI